MQIDKILKEIKTKFPELKVVKDSSTILRIFVEIPKLGPLTIMKLIYVPEEEIVRISFIKSSELIDGIAKVYNTAIPVNNIYAYIDKSRQNYQEIKAYIDASFDLDYIRSTLTDLEFAEGTQHNPAGSFLPDSICYTRFLDDGTKVQIEVWSGGFSYLSLFNAQVITDTDFVYNIQASTLDKLLDKLME